MIHSRKYSIYDKAKNHPSDPAVNYYTYIYCISLFRKCSGYLSITVTGKYLIDIQSNKCTFQSKYTVIRNEDTECGDIEKCVISIPNAVTPNGDGQNDELEIFLTPSCGSVESVTLWDKWGGVVFTTRELRIGQGVWEQLSPGVYMVKVVYKDKDRKVQVEAGSVMVLK